MNDYQNPNGQFEGWAQGNVPYGNAPFNNGYMPPFNEQYLKNEEKKKDKKQLRKMGSYFGLAVIAYVVLSFASAFVIAVLSAFFEPLNKLYDDSAANLSFSALGSVIFIGVPFALVYLGLKTKKLTGVLPLGTTYNKKAAAYLTMIAAPLMIISSIIVNAISLVIQTFLGLEFTSGLESLEANGVVGTLVCIISMAIMPAIIEEVAIRGVVLQPLRRYGDAFAIVASALIFSIMHGNMAQIPYTVVGGIYLGYLTIATGSVWPAIIVHFVNNLYSAMILIVESNFGETATYVVIVVMLGILVAGGIFGAVGFSSMRYKTKLDKGVDTLKTGEKISALFGNVPMIIAIVCMVALTLTSIE